MVGIGERKVQPPGELAPDGGLAGTRQADENNSQPPYRQLGWFGLLHLVEELWFAKIERDVISRGVFTSLPDLKRKLMRYIKKYNEQPKPIKWKCCDLSRRITPDSIVTVH